MEFKFKPFASKTELNLRDSKTIIQLFDNYLKATDLYKVDTLKDEDDEVLGTKETLIDAIITFPKSKIDILHYYFDNEQEGYFLQVNQHCWGFDIKEEGKIIFESIYNWLYEQ